MKMINSANKLLGWIFLFVPVILTAQKARNQTFFTGYFGAPPADSTYYNNMFIKRVDTGLVFSERIYSTYDFFGTQNSTYCDENGDPLLQWHGCALLDAKTFEPIINGDFSNGPGTHTTAQYCDKYTPEENLPDVTNYYAVPFSTFFLDRGDDRNVLLVYYRILSPPGVDSNYIYTASIDLKAEEGPTVIYKDSLLVDFPILSGSISAVRHANGIDWFIVFGEYISQNWHSVLYDHEGLHPTVVSKIDQWEAKKVEGLSKFTPDGSKYVLSAFNAGFIVLDYNRCNGKFTYNNQDEIPSTPEGGFIRFVETSPNGRFLYINDANKIHQYDFNDSNFSNSRIVVAKFDTSQNSGLPYKGYFTSSLKGYDNKLYYWSGNGVPRIHRIQFPDQKGPDVGWTQDFYKTPIYIPWFLSSFIDYGMGPLAGNPCESSTNIGRNYDFINCYPSPAQDVVAAAIDRKYNNASVVVYNVTGERVYEGDVPSLRFGIDISKWEPGPYIVHIDGRTAGRFMKVTF